MTRSVLLLVGALALVGSAGLAHGQADPASRFGEPEAVEAVEAVAWTATAEAGAIVTTGNSRTTTATAIARAARVAAKNKVEGQFALAYARSRLFIAVDRDASGTISADEIEAQRATTANNWQAKLRYDRFLTERSSLYVAGVLGADRPAGKELTGGAQAGYSRRLYKRDAHEVVAEVGYDFTYEQPLVADGVAIHSARVFAGYQGVIRQVTSLEASIEGLFNVNRVATVPVASEPLDDTRIHAGAGLTTKLTDAVSFSFGFQLRFDNRPAPRAPLAIPYEPGFVPVADPLDTLTKATLIVSLF
jgi:hypothetical protein